jgi:hypothetical protein
MTGNYEPKLLQDGLVGEKELPLQGTTTLDKVLIGPVRPLSFHEGCTYVHFLPNPSLHDNN